MFRENFQVIFSFCLEKLSSASSWWGDINFSQDVLIPTVVLFTTLFCLLFVGYTFYYFLWIVDIPTVRMSPSSALRDIVKNLPILQKKFWPTFWLWNGHLQTIRGGMDKWDVPDVQYKREIVDVHAVTDQHFDGHVAVDWAVTGYPQTPTTPTCIILHGLTGGSRARYVKVAVRKLCTENHWRVAVINARGCGGTTLQSPQAFCAAYTEDVRQVIRKISERYPYSPLYAIGYSLGSNILVKYLGEEGEDTPIRGAVSVANPFNLILSNRFLHSSWIGRQIYSRKLTANLVRLCASWLKIFEQREDVDLSMMSEVKTILEFDECFTSRTFGYPNADAYYHDSSCARYIENVAVPLMCINAEDDPICWVQCVPYTASVANENLIFVTTKAGGHSMDWFQGSFTTTPTSWTADVFSSFLQSLYFCRALPKVQTTPAAKTRTPVAPKKTNVLTHNMSTRNTDIGIPRVNMERAINQWDEVLKCLEDERAHRQEAAAILQDIPQELAKFREQLRNLTTRIEERDEKKFDHLSKLNSQVESLRSQLASVLR